MGPRGSEGSPLTPPDLQILGSGGSRLPHDGALGPAVTAPVSFCFLVCLRFAHRRWEGGVGTGGRLGTCGWARAASGSSRECARRPKDTPRTGGGSGPRVTAGESLLFCGLALPQWQWQSAQHCLKAEAMLRLSMDRQPVTRHMFGGPHFTCVGTGVGGVARRRGLRGKGAWATSKNARAMALAHASGDMPDETCQTRHASDTCQTRHAR